ncbi:unnamed protein product [Rotaria sp. Silwood1]|nr:unnamed protein product [Rotaria sp. Silwood1]
MIPQAAVLFSGTLRYNLDPSEQLSDEQYLMTRETNLKYNKDIQTTKNASYESLINSSVDNRLFDNYCPTINNDIIIKEVIINRNYPNERLGLTLCYGITSTSTINVYIEQVEKNSLADRQGQLQVGDQIIKINNHQVTNRDQTIHLVNGASKIILQIIRFKSTKIISSNVESQLRRSALKKSDSGVILASNTDFETNNQFIYKKCLNQYNLIRKISTSLTCLAYENCSNCHHNLLYSQQIQYRRCLSLNDLKICRIIEENLDYSKSIRKDLINCQEEFKIKKNYEKSIIKPLSFNDHHDKVIERYFSYLKEDIDHKKNPLLITTNDDTISQLKQNPYLIKEQRKKQFQRSKISKERFGLQENLINSITEDFNLLNRIFLHENEQELKEKPYLAIKYQQESISEKEKLEKILQQYEIDHPLRLQSTQNRTIYSTENNLSTVII